MKELKSKCCNYNVLLTNGMEMTFCKKCGRYCEVVEEPTNKESKNKHTGMNGHTGMSGSTAFPYLHLKSENNN